MLRCFGCKSRNRSSRKHKTFSEATIVTNVDSRATGQTPAVIGDSFAEQNGRTRRSTGQRTTSGKQPDQSLASFNIDYSSSRLSFQRVSPRTSYASACSDIFDIDPDSVGRDSVGTPQGIILSTAYIPILVYISGIWTEQLLNLKQQKLHAIKIKHRLQCMVLNN
jgi:hypothetical protein